VPHFLWVGRSGTRDIDDIEGDVNTARRLLEVCSLLPTLFPRTHCWRTCCNSLDALKGFAKATRPCAVRVVEHLLRPCGTRQAQCQRTPRTDSSRTFRGLLDASTGPCYGAETPIRTPRFPQPGSVRTQEKVEVQRSGTHEAMVSPSKHMRYRLTMIEPIDGTDDSVRVSTRIDEDTYSSRRGAQSP
jgi:hypothetical protein